MRKPLLKTANGYWLNDCGQRLEKGRCEIDEWLKKLAPSIELRKWYGQDPAKWTQFKGKYWKELEDKDAELLNSQKKPSIRLQPLFSGRKRKSSTMLLH